MTGSAKSPASGTNADAGLAAAATAPTTTTGVPAVAGVPPEEPTAATPAWPDGMVTTGVSMLGIWTAFGLLAQVVAALPAGEDQQGRDEDQGDVLRSSSSVHVSQKAWRPQ
jgi:hypothetical protein